MAVRQYVGARYVPQMMGDWNSQTVYEPLSVVTYNFGSYTSKKAVPAGVVPTNEEYWALTGQYNQQVEEYRQTVEEYKEEVDSIKTNFPKRTFMLFGDSLGDGYTPGVTNGKGWTYYVSQYLSNKGYDVIVAEDITTTNYGSAFSGEKTYTMHLNKTVQNNPDLINQNITDIIVYSGTNDANHVNTTESGIQEFVTAVKNYWPYANIKIGFFSAVYTANTRSVNNIFKTCSKYGASYINFSYLLACHKNYVSNDNVHLTQDGYQFYSPYLCQGVLTSTIKYQFTFEQNIESSSVITLTNTVLNIVIENDTVSLSLTNVVSDGAIQVTTTENNPTYYVTSTPVVNPGIPQCSIYTSMLLDGKTFIKFTYQNSLSRFKVELIGSNINSSINISNQQNTCTILL